MKCGISVVFTTILALSLATKKDNQAFYPDKEPVRDYIQPPFQVEKPFWQRFILNKMDKIAHLPKNIPYAEEILENIPFYGEDVYTSPTTHPYYDAHGVGSVYPAPVKYHDHQKHQ